MSFSIKNSFNTNKNIQQKINKNKNKVYGPINVKMSQIPNIIGFNNTIKTNTISNSYFNLNLKKKSNLILAKENKNNTNTNKNNNIDKSNNNVKSYYYSLIIPNKRNKKKQNTFLNNFTKLSINSIITNPINKTKNIINRKKNNLINEELSKISKHKNYSFNIKVKKINEKIIDENSRNNSLKKIYNSNDKYNNRQKTIIKR